MKTFVRTGIETWDSFCPTIEEFLSHDKSHFTVNGRPVSGYRSPDTTPIWLRDHAHQMKGFKYFEKDMLSALDIFDEYQMQDGAYYDFFDVNERHSDREGKEERQSDDAGQFTYDRFRWDRQNKLHFARCGVEADVEYLAVEAVYSAWQATGDDGWMAAKLNGLEQGMEYAMSSPIRWSTEHQLVKRPFTIDTWDFEYCGPPGESEGKYCHGHNVHGNYWCVMHGDNSGMFYASNLMAKMNRRLGREDRAAYWEDRARHFKQRTNEVCWNGRFYTHQVHITSVQVAGVDEAEQLSLSNSYDMNRGLPDHDQCVSIIREYMRRREMYKDEHMAEWYSINPPFPSDVFGLDYLHPGVYVNGGIMPLVGGELARASFEHGFEEYGVDILRRYHDMAIKPGKTFLWYHPDGTHWEGGSFLATDGWGSAAMLSAFVEGLCGVKDTTRLFETVDLAPRWAATGIDHVEVSVGYAVSGKGLQYTYNCMSSRLELLVSGTGVSANAHILIPQSKTVRGVKVQDQSVEWKASQIEGSTYADFVLPVSTEARMVEIEIG